VSHRYQTDAVWLDCGYCGNDIPTGTCHVVCGEDANHHVLYHASHCPVCVPHLELVRFAEDVIVKEGII